MAMATTIMSVEALHITLQQSFSPDASLRDPAEHQIRNLKHVKGSTVLLLQVAAEKQVGSYGMTRHGRKIGQPKLAHKVV
jgi:hypothetical protein